MKLSGTFSFLGDIPATYKNYISFITPEMLDLIQHIMQVGKGKEMNQKNKSIVLPTCDSINNAGYRMLPHTHYKDRYPIPRYSLHG